MRTTMHSNSGSFRNPVLVFSHLRWDFVFQRPQHLLSRFARERPVYYFEEPCFDQDTTTPALRVQPCPLHSQVTVLTPQLPAGIGREACTTALKHLLDTFLAETGITRPILWYYTPSMLPFSAHIEAAAVVYDCMDELASFRFASPDLPQRERELLMDADVVFTGGYSLYEQKQGLHRNVHPFPSGVDTAHFATARRPGASDATDQSRIPRPRLGFYGVLDERIDFALLEQLADARPDWHLIMVGPLAKISESELAIRPNIHYLGPKAYDQLPSYLAGWDAGLIPFALNDATRFISPTKTPEYLAGGVPVVSTAIRDVARQYRDVEGVFISENTSGFIAGCEAALSLKHSGNGWLVSVDQVLNALSWDNIFSRMQQLIGVAIAKRVEHDTIAAA